ncbi:hypothetical protein NQ317_006102, partial [Molorchus minor]
MGKIPSVVASYLKLPDVVMLLVTAYEDLHDITGRCCVDITTISVMLVGINTLRVMSRTPLKIRPKLLI